VALNLYELFCYQMCFLHIVLFLRLLMFSPQPQENTAVFLRQDEMPPQVWAAMGDN